MSVLTVSALSPRPPILTVGILLHQLTDKPAEIYAHLITPPSHTPPPLGVHGFKISWPAAVQRGKAVGGLGSGNQRAGSYLGFAWQRRAGCGMDSGGRASRCLATAELQLAYS